LNKQFPFHARQVAAALWSLASLGRTKFLMLVDADVDVTNLQQVWQAAGAHVAPERDLFWHEGPASTADHANTLGLLARHVAIDATAKIAGECPAPHPAPLQTSQETRDRVTARWAEYQLAAGRSVG
jgi:4-hydroxy-3-polyprenylbenzoate decarboxylase